jgi:hypothetical protein
MQTKTAPKQETSNFLRCRRTAVEGVAVEYRLSREKSQSKLVYSLSVTYDPEGRADSESLAAFTSCEAHALAMFHLAVGELILPNTLCDVWKELQCI